STGQLGREKALAMRSVFRDGVDFFDFRNARGLAGELQVHDELERSDDLDLAHGEGSDRRLQKPIRTSLEGDDGVRRTLPCDLFDRERNRLARVVLGGDTEPTARRSVDEAAVQPRVRHDHGLLERETGGENLSKDFAESPLRKVHGLRYEGLDLPSIRQSWWG